jgi:hypothetical protein
VVGKNPAKEGLPPGLAALPEFLEGLQELTRRVAPRGDRSSSKYKRHIAAAALGMVSKFLRKQGVSEVVPDALAEVGFGLVNLDSILEPVLDVVRSANRPPNPTTHYIIRADIVALLDAMTDGTPVEVARMTKREAAILIVKGLGEELHKVVSLREGKPDNTIKNWLGKFKNGQVPDEAAEIRFQKMRMRFRIDLLAPDPVRRRLFQTKIDEIKARLKRLPPP